WPGARRQDHRRAAPDLRAGRRRRGASRARDAKDDRRHCLDALKHDPEKDHASQICVIRIEDILMNMHVTDAPRSATQQFLLGRGPAWFAYAMTIALMIFDYVDRQVIVSMFPFLKAEWNLSDKELGLLVSVISITVAVFGIPVAWIADRVSRVKSITAMAVLWSIAGISCMFSQDYT